MARQWKLTTSDWTRADDNRLTFDRIEALVRHLIAASDRAHAAEMAYLAEHPGTEDDPDGFNDENWLRLAVAATAAESALQRGRWNARRFILEQRRSEAEAEEYSYCTLFGHPVERYQP